MCKDSFKEGNKYHLYNFVLENADYSYSCIKGICFNDRVMPMDIVQSFRKNEQYYIISDFDFLYNDELNEVSLLPMDMLDNYYVLKVNVNLHKDGRSRTIEINIVSGIEIVKVNVNFKNFTIEEIKD